MKSSPSSILPAAQAAAPASGTAAVPATLQGWPVLRLGFRPFYIGGALVACLSLPVWMAAFLGSATLDTTVPALLWHAHEMLFGFAATVIVGFLLTAVKAWTGHPTPRGAVLGALALLWLAARIAAFTAPYAVYAVLDMLLIPVVALLLLRVLLQADNRRNLPLMGILFLLALANGMFHLAALGMVQMNPVQPLYAGLALVVMVECVIAGRVVPFFTSSATPGLKIQMPQRQEMATLAATAVALLLWVFAPAGLGAVAGAALALAAVLQVARIVHWQPKVTLDRPILWILHLAYAWIPLGLALLALAQWGLVPTSAGVHALAVGATGGLIIGMLTRTARGHTGRPLEASRAEVLAYALVMAAAVLRVLVPLASAQWYVTSVVLAAAAWSVAFGIYLVVFTPWLVRSRIDGKDG